MLMFYSFQNEKNDLLSDKMYTESFNDLVSTWDMYSLDMFST